LVLVTGCVSNDLQRVSEINLNDKILVVSKFENTFPFKTVGFSAFQNDSFEIEVSDWSINSFIENTISEKLDINYMAITSLIIRKNVSIPKNQPFIGYPSSISNKTVLAEANKLNAKYILIVSPIDFPDVYFGTNQYINGNGVYKRNSNMIQHAQMSFNLFDATTGQFIATNGTIGHNGGDSVWITSKTLSGYIFESESDLTEETLTYIQTNNEELIKELVDRSLDFMNFKVNKT